jgi:hypothetical protein
LVKYCVVLALLDKFFEICTVFTVLWELCVSILVEELKRLLIICTQESHFQFNGEYYDQVDGVAMGSSLGPLFANIFMPHLEKKHMGTLKKLGVLMWKRYVDDLFAIVKDKQSART